MIRVDPHEKVLPVGIAFVNDTVAVRIQLPKRLESVVRQGTVSQAGMITEQFGSIVDASVAIAIERQETHLRPCRRPVHAIRRSIRIDIKADGRIHPGELVSAVLQIENDRRHAVIDFVIAPVYAIVRRSASPPTTAPAATSLTND